MSAIYIHWPFCLSKCPYCDFNSHVAAKIDQANWLSCYKEEINHFARQVADKKIGSIFFGGGTPSLMPIKTVEEIISHIYKTFKINNNIEITLEANPTSTENKKLQDFKSAGVNRISMGIQALNDNDLKFLGRQHSASEALSAIELLASNFTNYSFDLIYARPSQSLKAWQDELTNALKYSNKHLSLYQLTIEKGTPFYSAYQKKEFSLPDNDLAASMYELTKDILIKNGYENYEISNYAKPGFESAHNMAYWRYDDYIGIGPGAHSRVTIDGNKQSIMMIHSPSNWLASVKDKSHGIMQNSILSKDEQLVEKIMMGLRIKQGVNLTYNKTSKLTTLEKEGFIILEENKIKPTDKGFLVINKIISEVAGEVLG